MHEPLHVKNKEIMREQRIRKPLVKVEVFEVPKMEVGPLLNACQS